MILSWHVFCQGAFNVTPYLLLFKVRTEETRDVIKEACSIEAILCGLAIQWGDVGIDKGIMQPLGVVRTKMARRHAWYVLCIRL